MKLNVFGFTAGGFLLTALFWTAPAVAENVEERIMTLEQELQRLKSEQLELKKEATAAAKVLPIERTSSPISASNRFRRSRTNGSPDCNFELLSPGVEIFAFTLDDERSSPAVARSSDASIESG